MPSSSPLTSVLSVQLRLRPRIAPLASVAGVYNAVYVVGNMSGPTLYYGKGAGQDPTAAAVVSDVMELGRRVLQREAPRRLPSGAFQDDYAPSLRVLSMKEIESEYYIRMEVADRPGVLAQVAGALGDNQISIRSVIQRYREKGQVANIVIMTHKAREEQMQNALAAFRKLPVVKGAGHMIRIEANL